MENLMFMDEFEQYLMENEKSDNTINSYVTDVKQFINFYREQLTCNSLSELTTQDIKKYKEHLDTVKNKDGESISKKTINRKLASLSQFIVFLNEIHKMKITLKIRQLKIGTQNFVKKMLYLDDARRIIKAAEKEDDVRAKTLMYTLSYTGARVSEMLQIKVTDIEKDSITVKGKGSKYRNLLIPKNLKSQWRAYANIRLNTSEYLFTGERGAITRQTVHNIIKNYTGKARGINKSIAHAHSFRRLYARCLKNIGVHQYTIAQLLGHSVNITGVYMEEDEEELLKIINKLNLESDTPKKIKV